MARVNVCHCQSRLTVSVLPAAAVRRQRPRPARRGRCCRRDQACAGEGRHRRGTDEAAPQPWGRRPRRAPAAQRQHSARPPPAANPDQNQGGKSATDRRPTGLVQHDSAATEPGKGSPPPSHPARQAVPVPLLIKPLPGHTFGGLRARGTAAAPQARAALR